MIKGIDWLVMDVRNMSFKDGVVDVAIDKGTLDTMISGSLWEPPPEVRKITSEYVTEVRGHDRQLIKESWCPHINLPSGF